jgi:hypothetical protein
LFDNNDGSQSVHPQEILGKFKPFVLAVVEKW